MGHLCRRILVLLLATLVGVFSVRQGEARGQIDPGVLPETTDVRESRSQACRALMDKTWHEQEKSVWLALCRGLPADFPIDVEDKWYAITRDDRRHLSTDFVKTIFGDPEHQALLKNTRIKLSGVAIDDLDITGLASRSFVLEDVVINGKIIIRDCNFEDVIAFVHVKVQKEIEVTNVVARKFLRQNSQIDANDGWIILTDSRFEEFSLSEDLDPHILVYTSRISEIRVYKLGRTEIRLWQVSGGNEIDIAYSLPITISLSEIALTGNLRIIGVEWGDDTGCDGGKAAPLILDQRLMHEGPVALYAVSRLRQLC